MTFLCKSRAPHPSLHTPNRFVQGNSGEGKQEQPQNETCHQGPALPNPEPGSPCPQGALEPHSHIGGEDRRRLLQGSPEEV